MKKWPVFVVVSIFLGICTPVEGRNRKRDSSQPDSKTIKALQTIKLSYQVTDKGLELTWTPANRPPSGGLKITASADNPQPLYPFDGYVVWLSGTNKSSCTVPLKKAACPKPRFWRVCSVHKKNHRKYVALSNVIKLPAIDYKNLKPFDKKKRDLGKDIKSTLKKDRSKAEKKSSGNVAPAQSVKRPEKAFIIGHKNIDIKSISAIDIARAREKFSVWYGHTSHGSQITSGMQAMNKMPFKFSRSGTNNTLKYVETGGDLGHRGDNAWEQKTRRYLENGGNANVIMWSWCGGCSNNTPDGVDRYLRLMSNLEKDYPDRVFIYMTGHLDGSGKNGNLHKVNERIRDFCRKNNKVLFDFADIESYDPDGRCYLDKGATDSCHYRENGRRKNWAQIWISKNPDHGYALPSRAAHTHPLNGALKGRAFWVMMATLAGQSE